VRAGLIGALPTLNARTSDILEQWLADIVARAANAPHSRWRGTWAANLIAHRTNPRLQADLDLLVRFRAPMVITALGSPRDVVDRVHDYGGLVLADVNSVAYARRAAEHGVDGLILVAHGAGGHTGRMNPFALVEAVRGFWDGLIVLAGGISTGRGVRVTDLQRHGGERRLRRHRLHRRLHGGTGQHASALDPQSGSGSGKSRTSAQDKCDGRPPFECPRVEGRMVGRSRDRIDKIGAPVGACGGGAVRRVRRCPRLGQ